MSLRCARRRRPGCRAPSPVPSGCQSWIRLEQRPAREGTTRVLESQLYTSSPSYKTLQKTWSVLPSFLRVAVSECCRRCPHISAWVEAGYPLQRLARLHAASLACSVWRNSSWVLDASLLLREAPLTRTPCLSH